MPQVSPRKRQKGGTFGCLPSLLLICLLAILLGTLIGLGLDDEASHYSLLDTTKSLEAASVSATPINPMLSLEPSTKSFHPKWKLWTEMNPAEQKEALDEAGVYLKKYGSLVMKKGDRKQVNKHGTCDLFAVAGDGDHQLCLPAPEQPCTFISFGINDDPSFDRALADTWGCRGFAGDPTVDHPSKLHPKVTFHNIGASMIVPNEERLIDKGGEEEWWDISMPKLRFFLGLEKIEVVKLDCEGCEVALARDILREDPSYLFHVDQMSIETHVTRTWLNSTEHVYYFGMHFALLEEAGFQLEWSNVFGCSKRHEITGCMPELAEYGFPCGYKPWPGKQNVVLGKSCQDFLWKRYPKKI